MIKFADAEHTARWAREFARGLARPTLVLLSGDLGAGKTQITRWCLEALGVTDVASPTFAIHHRYEPLGIDHVDLYRLETEGELEDTGFWDLFDRPDGLVFVEWADRLPANAWPTSWTRVFLEIRLDGPGDQRAITMKVCAAGDHSSRD
jgi:tRNA threonylcarbamoyladenosine biosynthesis protein TsaE